MTSPLKFGYKEADRLDGLCVAWTGAFSLKKLDRSQFRDYIGDRVRRFGGSKLCRESKLS